MGEAVTVKSGGGMSILSKIPWTLLLIVYLLASGIQMEGVPGYVFIGLGVVVLFAEFFKSGDISSATFLTDIIFSVIALILATGLLTYMLFGLEQTPSFFHWFGYAIILGDAIISPFNSFRTALRNFGVGG